MPELVRMYFSNMSPNTLGNLTAPEGMPELVRVYASEMSLNTLGNLEKNYPIKFSNFM